jgi:hypothetical protein
VAGGCSALPGEMQALKHAVIDWGIARAPLAAGPVGCPEFDLSMPIVGCIRHAQHDWWGGQVCPYLRASSTPERSPFDAATDDWAWRRQGYTVAIASPVECHSSADTALESGILHNGERRRIEKARASVDLPRWINPER